MTPEEQQFILQNMHQHVVANRGNTITDVTAHGLMAVLTAITQDCIDGRHLPPKLAVVKPPEQEKQDGTS